MHLQHKPSKLHPPALHLQLNPPEVSEEGQADGAASSVRRSRPGAAPATLPAQRTHLWLPARGTATPPLPHMQVAHTTGDVAALTVQEGLRAMNLHPASPGGSTAAAGGTAGSAAGGAAAGEIGVLDVDALKAEMEGRFAALRAENEANCIAMLAVWQRMRNHQGPE